MSTETNVMPTPAGVRPPVTLKCTSPATVAAMRIARSAGLVTSTMGSPMGAAPRKGGDAGDGGGTLLVYDDEKENIDPVTGTQLSMVRSGSPTTPTRTPSLPPATETARVPAAETSTGAVRTLPPLNPAKPSRWTDAMPTAHPLDPKKGPLHPT